ncbi:MAG: hypothetical protein RIQ89_1329 [Bacteroidota bacterium]|jgi:DnaJ like chaperone protein
MSTWNKWIFGGLGWALGGPIGGILGFAVGAISEDATRKYKPGENKPNNVLPNDFSAALMVLCAAVMKADQKVMRSELEFVRDFFTRQFGESITQQRMIIFRELLKQDIAIGQVCQQIRGHVDHAARLQLLHFLFGVAAADGSVSTSEEQVISQISYLLGISEKDLLSIRAMFVKDATANYKILEIAAEASDDEVKKAYRKMAMKYHPDKVHHLGPDFQKDAQEKFRKINDAFEQIKKQRGFS